MAESRDDVMGRVGGIRQIPLTEDLRNVLNLNTGQIPDSQLIPVQVSLLEDGGISVFRNGELTVYVDGKGTIFYNQSIINPNPGSCSTPEQYGSVTPAKLAKARRLILAEQPSSR